MYYIAESRDPVLKVVLREDNICGHMCGALVRSLLQESSKIFTAPLMLSHAQGT